MPLRDFLLVLICKARRETAGEFLRDVCLRLAALFFYRNKYILYKRDMADFQPAEEPEALFKIRLADAGDIRQLQRVLGPLRVRRYLEFLRKGRVCFVATVYQSIVYFSWVSFEQQSFVRLKNGQAYFFDAFTLPPYRNRGIHAYATAERLKFIKAKGCSQALALISPGNHPARQALSKNGFQPCGHACVWGIPWLRLKQVKVQQEENLTVESYGGLICNCKRAYLFLLTLQEILTAFFPKKAEAFYEKWKHVPQAEFDYLRQHYDLSRVKSVICIGAGAVAYTGIFFFRNMHRPVYLIEKNRLARFACKRLLNKLGMESIQIFKNAQLLQQDCANSLIIIGLHVQGKQEVASLAYRWVQGKGILIIRQPLLLCRPLYESVRLEGAGAVRLDHQQDFVSLVIGQDMS